MHPMLFFFNQITFNLFEKSFFFKFSKTYILYILFKYLYIHNLDKGLKKTTKKEIENLENKLNEMEHFPFERN